MPGISKQQKTEAVMAKNKVRNKEGALKAFTKITEKPLLGFEKIIKTDSLLLLWG